MKNIKIDNYKQILRNVVKDQFSQLKDSSLGSGVDLLIKLKTNLHSILNNEVNTFVLIDRNFEEALFKTHDLFIQNENEIETVKLVHNSDGKHPFSL